MHACIRIVFRLVGIFVSGKHVAIHQPEMRVSMKFLQIQREQCRHLRCTECCFCGGQFSEVPVQQEPDEPDGNGGETEQQMDKNAGWDEGTCAQCGACYLRSIIRPVICQCGAELCGYSFRCLLAHAKRCAAASQEEHCAAARQEEHSPAIQEKDTEKKNKEVDFEANSLPYLSLR